MLLRGFFIVLLATLIGGAGFMAYVFKDEINPSILAKGLAAEGGRTAARAAGEPVFADVQMREGGAALLAGYAPIGSEVEVFSGGKSLGQAFTSDGGEWVLVLDELAVDAPLVLSLADRSASGENAASGDTAIILPGRSGEPLILFAHGGAPSYVRQFPDELSGGRRLSLQVVDQFSSGEVFAGGWTGGSLVRLYLDNQWAADSRPDAEGIWTADLSAAAAGAYTFRIDELNQAGLVIDRIELPLERVRPQGPSLARLGPAEMTVDQGAALWRLHLSPADSDRTHILHIYAATEDQRRDAIVAYPGQIPGSQEPQGGR